MKQLDFDPVSLPDSAADAACLQQHSQVDVDVLCVDGDSDSSSIAEFLGVGTASARPSYRRRAALDSDTDSEQGALLFTDSNHADAGLQSAEGPSGTSQKGQSIYDFSAYSSDDESCVKGRMHNRASRERSPKPAESHSTDADTQPKSRQHSNDVIVLSSSADSSPDDGVRLQADGSELSRYLILNALAGIITAE